MANYHAVHYNNRSRKGTYLVFTDNDGYKHIIKESYIPIQELFKYYEQPAHLRSRKAFNQLRRSYESDSRPRKQLNPGSTSRETTTSVSEGSAPFTPKKKIPRTKPLARTNVGLKSGIHSVSFDTNDLSMKNMTLQHTLKDSAFGNDASVDALSDAAIRSRTDHEIHIYGVDSDTGENVRMADIFIHGITLKELKEKYHSRIVSTMQNKNTLGSKDLENFLKKQFPGSSVKLYIHRGTITNGKIVTRIRN